MAYRGKAEKALTGIGLGERIVVEKGDWRIEGVLMPRSELGDADHVVIKLENGYNVGVAIEGAKIKKAKK